MRAATVNKHVLFSPENPEPVLPSVKRIVDRHLRELFDRSQDVTDPALKNALREIKEKILKCIPSFTFQDTDLVKPKLVKSIGDEMIKFLVKKFNHDEKKYIADIQSYEKWDAISSSWEKRRDAFLNLLGETFTLLNPTEIAILRKNATEDFRCAVNKRIDTKLNSFVNRLIRYFIVGATHNEKADLYNEARKSVNNLMKFFHEKIMDDHSKNQDYFSKKFNDLAESCFNGKVKEKFHPFVGDDLLNKEEKTGIIAAFHYVFYDDIPKCQTLIESIFTNRLKECRTFVESTIAGQLAGRRNEKVSEELKTLCDKTKFEITLLWNFFGDLCPTSCSRDDIDTHIRSARDTVNQVMVEFNKSKIKRAVDGLVARLNYSYISYDKKGYYQHTLFECGEIIRLKKYARALLEFPAVPIESALQVEPTHAQLKELWFEIEAIKMTLNQTKPKVLGM